MLWSHSALQWRAGPEVASGWRAGWRLNLLKPVITEANLDSVELRIIHSEIRVGDVRPSHAKVNRSFGRYRKLNSTAAPRGEVEV